MFKDVNFISYVLPEKFVKKYDPLELSLMEYKITR